MKYTVQPPRTRRPYGPVLTGVVESFLHVSSLRLLHRLVTLITTSRTVRVGHGWKNYLPEKGVDLTKKKIG